MKKPKHLIFDCDGVLVDSEIIANQVEADVKCELGFPITLEEQITKFTGHGFTSSVVQDEMNRLPENYWQIVDDRCKEAYARELKAIRGVAEVLKALSHPKCVASSSRADWLDLKLTLAGLKSFFPNAIFSGDDVVKCKPAPDLFFHAMAKMDWQASDCLVIEDSVAGVTAGKSAGLVVCGFVGGSHVFPGHAERLLKAGADYIVSDIRNIIRIVS
jgi:HAD superfamily hydrolase (TIGR01509 family)